MQLTLSRLSASAVNLILSTASLVVLLISLAAFSLLLPASRRYSPSTSIQAELSVRPSTSSRYRRVVFILARVTSNSSQTVTSKFQAKHSKASLPHPHRPADKYRMSKSLELYTRVSSADSQLRQDELLIQYAAHVKLEQAGGASVEFGRLRPRDNGPPQPGTEARVRIGTQPGHISFLRIRWNITWLVSGLVLRSPSTRSARRLLTLLSTASPATIAARHRSTTASTRLS
jgi:hypothetical protein